jgi:hypothetical protein
MNSLKLTFPYPDPAPKYYSSKPLAAFPASTWESYSAASAHLRAAAGVSRLTRSQAALVRSAVARHAERAGRKPSSYQPILALRERIRSETLEAVRPRIRGLYRVYTLDGLRVSISARHGCDASTSTKYVSGRGGFGHVTDGQRIDLNVCPSWRRRVEAEGLAVCDGLFTTHATPVLEAEGITVYRAAWVRQGRGYDLNAEGGCLARHADSGTTYHSADGDPAKALAGLERKLKVQGTPIAVRDAARAERARKAAQRKARKLAGLADRFRRWDLADIAHVEVTRDDSLRAGNCGPGTDEFIARFAPGRDSATIGDLAAAVGRVDPSSLSASDLELGRQLAAACLRAIRRDKSARRLVPA